MSKNTNPFSIKGNLAILAKPKPGQLRPVDGLRAISILLVLAHHSFWFLTIFAPESAEFFYQTSSLLNWVYNGELGVDVFFVISGFLISSLLMNEYQKTGEIRFFRFYQRRFLRLMPAYILAILVGLLLLPENRQYVWTNLLYINNLMPAETHFMPWTWSLAIEEQFYFLYPLLLILALRFIPPRLFIYLAMTLLFISFLIRYLVISHYQLSLPFCWYSNSCERFFDIIDYLYDKPWTRFGSFLPGIFAAYLHVYKRKQLVAFFTNNRPLVQCLLVISIAMGLTALFIPVNNQHVRFGETFSTLYYTSYRNLFTLAIGFIMVASLYCQHGLGALFQKLLSSRLLYPIGQLAYSAYLFHPFVYAIAYGVLFEIAKEMSYWQKITIVASAGTLITLLLSATVYIFVERPFMNMRRELPMKLKEKPKEPLIKY